MDIIEAKNLFYTYEGEASQRYSLEGIDFRMKAGEFVVLLGQNGSGKSTLAKHFNGLLPLQQGNLYIAGLDVRDPANLWDIRRKCGMVFQNPDNQFISSVIEEDIAFGLENYDFPPEQIAAEVHKALALVGMAGFEKKSPHMLSGGQKQRVALAGVLAISPEIIIFDESTAMLDIQGRQEILQTIQQLHQAEHKSIIHITHRMEEAVLADRIDLMKAGRIVASGPPRRILADLPLLTSANLLPPLPVRLYEDLRNAGIHLAECPLTIHELTEQLCRLS